MHAFLAGSLPIYWGNPDVGRDFNLRAFINCGAFASFDDVIDHAIVVDRDDSLLARYLAEPPFVGNRFNEFIDADNVLARFEASSSERWHPVEQSPVRRSRTDTGSVISRLWRALTQGIVHLSLGIEGAQLTGCVKFNRPRRRIACPIGATEC